MEQNNNESRPKKSWFERNLYDDYRCSGDIRIENVPYAWMIIKVVSVERGVGCKCVQLFFCFLKNLFQNCLCGC